MVELGAAHAALGGAIEVGPNRRRPVPE